MGDDSFISTHNFLVRGTRLPDTFTIPVRIDGANAYVEGVRDPRFACKMDGVGWIDQKGLATVLRVSRAAHRPAKGVPLVPLAVRVTSQTDEDLRELSVRMNEHKRDVIAIALQMLKNSLRKEKTAS